MRDLLLGAVAVLAGAPARAHDIADPRVLVVVVREDRVEVRVNELTAVAESAELRRRFDGDRDGRLDDSEESDLASFLAIRATKNLSIERDGAAVPLDPTSRRLRGGARVDAGGPLSIDVILTGALAESGGLTLRDWRADDHAVRAVVQTANGVRLASASSGTIDLARGLLTGVSLDRTQALTIEILRDGGNVPTGRGVGSAGALPRPSGGATQDARTPALDPKGTE